MMGRAGRPQYDTKGVAVVMVHEPKKAFYKRFLYEPFPVESSLQDQVGGWGGGASSSSMAREAAHCLFSWAQCTHMAGRVRTQSRM
jgi:replicative superfamily II helicase